MSVAFWFRRDLRLEDNEALVLASRESAAIGTPIAPFYLGEQFVTRVSEFQPSPLRQASLIASLTELDRELMGNLRWANTLAELVPALVKLGVKKVFAAKAFDPAGIEAESKVEVALRGSGIELNLNGSGYAVAPGMVRKDDGSPLKVYTPFFRRWAAIDPRTPLPVPNLRLATLPLPSISEIFPASQHNVRAGSANALRTLRRFLESRVATYDVNRDRADLGGTSHLSHALSHGEIHPRTILAQLPAGAGAEVFRKEVAWREFYADVLYHRPDSLWGYFDQRYASMRYDSGSVAEEKFEAWRTGNTGYPIVDAGMRQLATTGWMHNRVRMITASFLVKDLHLPWVRGADWFESQLTDFDPASNSHGWQWTAGCGTDASPYFRVFNPTLQGQKFDPTGNYVRQFVPELDHLSAKEIHEPWKYINGLSRGYASPIVDHATERDEALRRLDELKQRVDRHGDKD